MASSFQCEIPNANVGHLGQIPNVFNHHGTTMSALALANPKHLSATCRAHTLSCRLTVLHGYALRVLHFPLGAAFNTIGLHQSTSRLQLQIQR